METSAIVIVALIALFGFRQWLGHHRRIMLHRERMAAIEKGIELPPVEQELRRSTSNVQRVLLLMGLIWVSLAIALFVTTPDWIATTGGQSQVPSSIRWAEIAPM